MKDIKRYTFEKVLKLAAADEDFDFFQTFAFGLGNIPIDEKKA